MGFGTKTKIGLVGFALLAAGCSASSGGAAPSVATVTQAASAAGEYDYGFDGTGLVTSVGTASLSYAVARSGDTLTAGADTYRLDPLGRTSSIDDLTLTYGPDGQVASATRGAETVSYLYDEDGERILKSRNGTPSEAYFDGAHLTETELDEPVKVAGHLVGVVRNGTFALAATDVRGTVQADTDGTLRLASPFGARPQHPDVAPALDYAEKGFDDVLGADRMGVRDYDARIARFLEPDPEFLLHPEKCVESPLECNLYGYAKGSPVSLIDPSGKNAREIVAKLAPHLFNTSISTPLGGVTLTAGIRGDNAGTFYLTAAKGPLLLSPTSWTAAAWKNPFSMSVTLSTIVARTGEKTGPNDARVDSFATGPSVGGSGCYVGCVGVTHNGSGTSVDYGIGVGIGAKGNSLGVGAGGSYSWRLGNPAEWISKRVFELRNPNWRGDSPAEKAYAAEHGPARSPSTP
jgi:RHS repeat-associated protein